MWIEIWGQECLHKCQNNTMWCKNFFGVIKFDCSICISSWILHYWWFWMWFAVHSTQWPWSMETMRFSHLACHYMPLNTWEKCFFASPKSIKYWWLPWMCLTSCCRECFTTQWLSWMDRKSNIVDVSLNMYSEGFNGPHPSSILYLNPKSIKYWCKD